MTTGILARRALRVAAFAALANAVRSGGIVPPATLDSPGDWPTPSQKLPAILLRNGPETKISNAKTLPDFTSSPTIEISARLEAATAAAAQDAIELLGSQIEQALFTDYTLLTLVSEIARVDSTTEITASGGKHFGALTMVVTLETTEIFQPAAETALTAMGVHLDMTSPFDASGTYPAPTAPPYTPPAAPRTTGPDGRDEGALDIDLPQ